jgi:hypothetical protein
MSAGDWTDNRRRDGLSVAPDHPDPGQARWLVLPGDGRPPVAYCPCCDRRMLTAEAAQLVADEVYPLGRPQ